MISKTLFAKELEAKDNEVIKIVDRYQETASIIERTKAALGKKKTIELVISSSSTGKLKNSIYAPSH